MNQKQHTQRHKALHGALGELVRDWIMSTDLQGGNFFTNSITLADFMKWSHEQSENATPVTNSDNVDISKFSHSHPRIPSYINKKVTLYVFKR